MPLWFDRNLLPEFESVKDENEDMLWIGKPRFVPYSITSLLPGVGVVLFIIVARVLFTYAEHDSKDGSSIFGTWILVLPLLLFVIQLLNKLLSFGNTSYACTNKRVMMRTGFIGTDFKSIDYDKISDIEVTVNIIERFCNVGTIKFFSGRTETDEGRISKLYDRWEAIADPYEVFKLVKKVSVDIKTDFNYPNALRPEKNPGYNTKYDPGDQGKNTHFGNH